MTPSHATLKSPDLSAPTLDEDVLAFPAEMAKHIGLATNQIAFLKKRGCPFYGRKTTIRWVRAFLAHESGANLLPGIAE